MRRKQKKVVEVRSLEVGDIAELAKHLRVGDRLEIEAALGRGVNQDVVFHAIAGSVMSSSTVWAGTVNGELACLFGVGPVTLLTNTGRPWLLATPLFDKEPSSIARMMRVYLRKMLKDFPHLENWVFAGNTKAVKWLGQLGFRLHPAEPWGFAGEPFHRFDMGTA